MVRGAREWGAARCVCVRKGVACLRECFGRSLARARRVEVLVGGEHAGGCARSRGKRSRGTRVETLFVCLCYVCVESMCFVFLTCQMSMTFDMSNR